MITAYIKFISIEHKRNRNRTLTVVCHESRAPKDSVSHKLGAVGNAADVPCIVWVCANNSLHLRHFREPTRCETNCLTATCVPCPENSISSLLGRNWEMLHHCTDLKGVVPAEGYLSLL